MIKFEKRICAALLTFTIATASAMAQLKSAPGIKNVPENNAVAPVIVPSNVPEWQSNYQAFSSKYDRDYAEIVAVVTSNTAIAAQFLFFAFAIFYVTRTLRKSPRVKGKLISVLCKALILMVIGLALPHVVGLMLVEPAKSQIFNWYIYTHPDPG